MENARPARDRGARADSAASVRLSVGELAVAILCCRVQLGATTQMGSLPSRERVSWDSVGRLGRYILGPRLSHQVWPLGSLHLARSRGRPALRIAAGSVLDASRRHHRLEDGDRAHLHRNEDLVAHAKPRAVVLHLARDADAVRRKPLVPVVQVLRPPVLHARIRLGHLDPECPHPWAALEVHGLPPRAVHDGVDLLRQPVVAEEVIQPLRDVGVHLRHVLKRLPDASGLRRPRRG
mmetsp:Transcript_87299/g.189061  ORF Transcript_87299/g.189061 Transcript_87299/m.189061 type:complete len:236 (-) Transcript_87299:88-795(-)